MITQKSRFKSIVAGAVLGDACVTKNKKGVNASIRIQHTIKQEEYLIYKAKILSSLTSVRINYLKPTDKRHPNWNIACMTKTHPFYTRTHKLIYSTGRKTVPKTLLSWLDAEGLAIWYMDDGTIMKHNVYSNGIRKVKSWQIKLCTYSFTLPEHELMKEFIEKRFGVKFKILKNGQYYYLGAAAREASKFFDIIRPFIIPCMEYKLYTG